MLLRLLFLLPGLAAGLGCFAQDSTGRGIDSCGRVAGIDSGGKLGNGGRRAARVDTGGERRVSNLDQVVVTGVSKAMRVRESPLAIAVVTGRQLDRSADNTVIDAIVGRVAGFHQGIPDGSRDSLSRKFTRQVDEAAGATVSPLPVDEIRNRPLVTTSDLNSYQVPALSQRIQNYRVYLDNEYRVGEGVIKGFVGWEKNIRRELNHPTAPTLPGEWLVLQTLNYNLRYNAPEFWGIESTIGIGGMYQDNVNGRATDRPIPDYRLFDVGDMSLRSGGKGNGSFREE
jgi:hypothetical protein